MFNRKISFSLVGILLVMPFIGNTLGAENKDFSKTKLSPKFEVHAFQYLEQNKTRYHLDNPQENFKLSKIQLDRFGLAHSSFQQYHDGVPIYGSAIKLHQDADGIVLSVSEEHADLNDNIDTEPAISPKKAIGIVRQHFTKLGTNIRIENSKIKISQPQLYIYDRSFFSNEESDPKLTWRLIAQVSNTPIQYVYYIDAQTGEVIHSLSTTAHALDRETYALSTTPDCNTETLTYNEVGLFGTYDADAGWVHLYAGYAYDYFYDTFARDSFDDEDPDDTSDGGGTIKSYTHYRDPDGCTDDFDAAWVSQSTEPYEFMYFAEGVYSQDIVGHEFTHGVVDHSANFEYENESGALDESYADIFGTLIEQYTGETDWTIGEDLPTNRSGCTTALRSLADPTAYTGQCDGSGDSLPNHESGKLELDVDAGEEPSEDNDNGYVHTNSSITNYAFYLLAVGGTHPTSSITVTGIGTSAAAELYYQALTNYLSINSDFDDAYEQTLTACLDLNNTDSTTYPISYCESVFDAFAAVGINTDTSYAWANISASSTSGTAPLAITFDAADSMTINSTIASYAWDFGDGSTDTAGAVSHTFTDPGTYTVTLTVTDSNSITGTASTTITVYATGTISSDTTWSAEHSPYVISSSLTVASTATLTIEPNVVVKFASAHGTVSVDGILDAQGTSVEPIIFTSYYDDNAGGDTNNDGSATAPAAGDWSYLYFGSTSTATLDYVTIRYGGTTAYSSDYAMVRFNSDAVTISNSTISDSAYDAMSLTASPTLTDNTIRGSMTGSYDAIEISSGSPTLTTNTITDSYSGIYVSGTATPTLTNNTFTDNYYVIYLAALNSGTSLTGNTGSDNDVNGIILQGSTSGDSTLRDDNALPYLISNLTVTAGDTLTIEPGLVLKFYPAHYDSYTASSTTLTVFGTLTAIGTSTDPIVLTSYYDDTFGGDTDGADTTTGTPGDWDYVAFASGSSVTIDYAIIQYGSRYSSSSSDYPMLNIQSDDVTIQNSTITQTEYQAIMMYAAHPTLHGNTISSTNLAAVSTSAVYIDGGSPTITENTFTDNTIGIMTTNGATPTLTHNLLSDNAYAIYNADSTVTVDAESNWWDDASGPYNVTSNPSGTGDTVGSDIDFDPWLTSSDYTPPSDVTLGTIRKDVWSQTLTVNWTNPTDTDFDHVQLDRTDVTAGTTTTLSTTETGTSYTDSTPNYSTTYTYTIVACDTSSNCSTGVTTTSQRLRNPAPTNLVLTPGDTTITASWTASSAPAATLAGYKVYYGTNPAALSTTLDVGNVTTTTLTGLTNGTRYYVAVTADSRTGVESARSTIRATRPRP